jgi:hypothetical protein
MPRERARALRSETVATGFVASANRLRPRTTIARSHTVRDEKWQHKVWHFFDTVGEYRAACSWIANMLSKATLYVEGPDGKPVTEGPAYEALQALFGGPEGHSEMLRLIGLCLTVSGDSYLIGISSDDEDEDDDWMVVPAHRIASATTASGMAWFKVEGDDEPLPDDAFVMRLWRGHPADRRRGDSNSRAALPILGELDTLTKRVAADSDSRLTGNGLLILPSEVSFPTLPTTQNDDEADPDAPPQEVRAGADGLMDLLIEVASISMADQDNAVAKVPIVIQMPGDQIGKVKHITFWSGFDSETKGLRAEAIQRIALAMDMPPEALTGTAGMNHWGSWQMEEAAIKIHTEPLLDFIVSAITRGYLRPVLTADGEDDDGEIVEGMSADDARGYRVRFDDTAMRLRPDKSKDALELYDRGAINLRAMIRELGFTEADEMGGAELTAWLVKKVAQGSTTPELVAAALQRLGFDPGPIETRPAAEARPTPSLEGHPTRELPREEVPAERPAAASVIDGARERTFAASEALVFRALERAGNRLKSRGVRPDGVAAADLYLYASVGADDVDDLLDDAWSCATRLSALVPIPQVESYTRHLILSKAEHDPETLRRYLQLAEVRAAS